MKQIKNTNQTPSVESKLISKINSILLRKDIVEINNDRVDTLRLLTYLLENNGKPSQLIKFLKAA